jgi:hypothetical protein
MLNATDINSDSKSPFAAATVLAEELLAAAAPKIPLSM